MNDELNLPREPKFLTCIVCLKLTTDLEAGLRLFHNGKCASCGGDLIERPKAKE